MTDFSKLNQVGLGALRKLLAETDNLSSIRDDLARHKSIMDQTLPAIDRYNQMAEQFRRDEAARTTLMQNITTQMELYSAPFRAIIQAPGFTRFLESMQAERSLAFAEAARMRAMAEWTAPTGFAIDMNALRTAFVHDTSVVDLERWQSLIDRLQTATIQYEQGPSDSSEAFDSFISFLNELNDALEKVLHSSFSFLWRERAAFFFPLIIACVFYMLQKIDDQATEKADQSRHVELLQSLDRVANTIFEAQAAIWADAIREQAQQIVTDSAIVRVEPDGESKIIDRLATGRLVKTLRTEGRWSLVQFESVKAGGSVAGWVVTARLGSLATEPE